MSTSMPGLQGRWNRVKGDIQRKWGQITDDDLRSAEGNVDQLVGLIQERTGETRDAIKSFLDHLADRSGSAVSAAVESLGSHAHELSDSVRDHYGEVSRQAHERYTLMRDHVGRNPVPWLSVAFGAGVLTGLIMKHRNGARYS